MSRPNPSSKSLFLAAFEIESDTERAAFLQHACGENDPLREEIESLLDAYSNPPDLLKHLDEYPPTGAQHIAEAPGTKIGPYELVQQIGEGGFGVVYMAEQQEPVRRKVAVKIIKPGMDSREVLARFEAERQAVAMMDHPNIARVLDAGTTDSGRPYFVMDLVLGVPITEFCDEHQLTPRERLELFIPVCHAVQHAHQKGIIHRDIKPCNVLVAEYDGRAVPRIIDFGVAKATQQPPTEKTTYTRTGQLVGTVDYMSPEQANLNELDIDTRSDIYSLGVVLYELLTGLTPIDRRRLRSAPFDELLQIIRKEEPPKPSTRISAIGETAGTVFAQRNTELKKLGHLLRGDLDWIVMKALEKDRTRRYGTANGFAADIERYLDDEPVLACPPSTLYRIRKFARRNKAIMTTVGLVAVSLVLATVTLAISSLLLAHERDVAENARESEQRQREQVSNLAQQLKLQLYDLRIEQAHAAVSHHEFERADRILRSCVPKRGEPDRRSFEWYYLWRSCQRVLKLPTLREGFSLHSAAYSRDGEYLALGLWSGGVAVYDSESLELIWRSTSHLDVVNDILFTPDSELLITASRDKSLKVWQVATGEQRLSQPLNLAVSALAISADGETLVTGFSQADQASREPIHISILHLDRSTHEVMLEALPDGELQGLVGRVHSLAISKNGRHLAGCCDDERIRVWNREDGQMLPLEGHSGTVRDLAFSPTDENMLASVSFEESVTEESVGEIKLWDIRDGSEIATLRLRALPRSITFSHDGSQLIAGDHDGMVRIWNVDLLASVEKTVKKGSDRSDPAFQPPLLHIAHQFSAHSKQVNDIVFSPNGQSILTVSHDQTAKIWSIRKLADEPSRFIGHGASIFRLSVSHDSRMLVSAGADGIAKLWDARTGRNIAIVEPKSRAEHLLAADFSPDDKSLAIAGGYWRQPNEQMELFLWDLTTGERRVLFSGSTSGGNTTIGGVAFSPNGERVATAIGTEVRIWNVDTTELSKVLRGHTTHVYDVDWCAQTNHIATVGAGPTVELKLWDGASEKVLATLPVSDDVWRLVFSPNGQRIALAAGGDVLLCDVDSRTFVRLDAHTDSVSDIAFSPDGRRLASASHDRTVKLWNLETGKLLLTFREPKNPVWSVCFSPDGRALFAAIDHLENSVIRAWRAATPDEVQEEAIK